MVSTNSVTVVLATLAFATTLAASADGAQTDAGCKKAKFIGSARNTATSLGCHGKAAGKAVPVEATCLAKADDALAASFLRTEKKGGCATTEDAPTVEARIDGCVDVIVGALGSSALKNKCLKGKLEAAGKKASAKLKCTAAAVAKSVPVDPKCLAKAATAFASAWSKLEKKTGCPTLGDVDAIAAIVDGECVLPVEAALGRPTPSPTLTVTVTTPTLVPTATPTPVPTATPTPVPTATPAPEPTATPTTVSFTSAEATTFRVGAPGIFTVTTLGTPIPSISLAGQPLPNGVTFVDNGNGTGTLSGTPATGAGGVYPLTFTAHNGVPPGATQAFTINVIEF